MVASNCTVLTISLHKVVSTIAIVMNLAPETICILHIFSTFKGLKEFDKNDKSDYNLRTYISYFYKKGWDTSYAKF